MWGCGGQERGTGTPIGIPRGRENAPPRPGCTAPAHDNISLGGGDQLLPRDLAHWLVPQVSERVTRLREWVAGIGDSVSTTDWN